MNTMCWEYQVFSLQGHLELEQDSCWAGIMVEIMACVPGIGGNSGSDPL